MSLFGAACGLTLVACLPAEIKTNQALSDRARRLDELIERHERLGRFAGAVAVTIDGELVFAGGYGHADRESLVANTPETRFALASLSKQFTAAAILQLETEGRLSVDDPISTHLPDYSRPQADRVKIHHLLSHTSGIPSLWRLGDGLEDVEATSESIEPSRLLAFFDDRDLLFDPGERFRYSNSGYVVLAAIIAAVSGDTYEDYLEKKIFRPLGMNDTGCRAGSSDAKAYHGYPGAIRIAPHEDPSWSIGDGCMRSTALDLARWDAALRNDSFLPPAQRAKMFSAHAEPRSGARYGYGWFLSRSHDRDVAHHGGAGEGVLAEMHRFADGLSIVVLANYAPELGINAPAAIVDQTAALLFDRPFEEPPAVVDTPDADLEKLRGSYTMDSGGRLHIALENGRLWIEASDKERSVFDFGALTDPGVFAPAADFARDVLSAALADDFSDLSLCEPLRRNLGPGELRDEWREMLGGRGKVVGMTTARTTRYRGEDTLIVVTRLLFERGEIFFALDLTPDLEICGWYGMDPAEFEIRRVFGRYRRVPLLASGPTGLLADGFNYGERDVRLSFRDGAGGKGRTLTLRGAVENSGTAETPP